MENTENSLIKILVLGINDKRWSLFSESFRRKFLNFDLQDQSFALNY